MNIQNIRLNGIRIKCIIKNKQKIVSRVFLFTFFTLLSNPGLQDVHLISHMLHGPRTLPRFAHEHNDYDENNCQDGSAHSTGHVNK